MAHDAEAVALLESAQTARATYERTLSRPQLDLAIRDYEALLRLLPECHPDVPAHKNDLAAVYLMLGQYTGDSMHFQHAHTLAIQVWKATPRGDPCLSKRLHALAAICQKVLERDYCQNMASTTLRHLDEALSLAGYQNSISARIMSTRAAVLARLALQSAGAQRIQHAKEAFSNIEVALEFSALQPEERADIALNSASALLHLYDGLPKDLGNLDRAIALAEESVRLLPPCHHWRADCLNKLACGHYLRWRSREPAPPQDMRLTLQYAREALSSLPRDHELWARLMMNIASAAFMSYTAYGDLEDLDRAIELLSSLVKTLSPDHPHISGRLTTLGRALVQSFRNRGRLNLLDEAIECTERAILYDRPTSDGWIYRRHMGQVLVERYLHQHDSTALESAVKSFEMAFTKAGLPHERHQLSVDLGRALTLRYLANGCKDDLNKAIEHIRTFTESPPDQESPDDLRGVSYAYDALGQATLARYEGEGCLQDLHMAIRSFERALNSAIARQAHPLISQYYCNSGRAKQLLFLATESAEHLDAAIDLFRTSIALTGKSHPMLASYRYEAASALISRFDLTHSHKDLVEASALLRAAYVHEQSFVKDRWRAARAHAALLHRSHPAEALESYEVAISLLPRVAWLGLEEHVRYETAQEWLSLGNDAAACALTLSKPEIAVELLENSRSVLWTQLLQLTKPDSMTETGQESELANELRSVGRALEASIGEGAVGQLLSEGNLRTQALEQANRARRRLAERWEELLSQVRSLPGSQNFLRRASYVDLRSSATGGPVIVINISQYRSDGIIITATGAPRVFPLPNATADVISLHARHLVTVLGQGQASFNMAFLEGQASQILETLWLAVGRDVSAAVQPLLPPGRLSRVWLMPTGPLSALPLHAAISGGPDLFCLQDIMIPSYTPSLSVLVRAQPRARRTVPSNMLAIGYCGGDEDILRSWVDEKSALTSAFTMKALTVLENTEATTAEFLSQLSTHNFVHVACHGHHDWLNPYRSHLALYDGPLTLRRLAQQRLEHADFAFLSACHTARVDPRAPDESVHLASGLNLAGFRSMIATMWGIADCDAGTAAQAVYSHLARDGRSPDPTEAAEALHKAVQTMRSAGLPAIRWAPFIHIGL